MERGGTGETSEGEEVHASSGALHRAFDYLQLMSRVARSNETLFKALV